MEKLTVKDVVLFPKKLYLQISDRVSTLYLGIVMVGMFNCIGIINNIFVGMYTMDSFRVQTFNISVSLTIIILMGLMNVVFFSMPMFDYLKKKRKTPVINNSSAFIKFMKIYCVAHLPVAVVYVGVMLAEQFIQFSQIPGMKLAETTLLFFILPAWFSAIMVRGARVLFELDENMKPIMFIVIFAWNFMVTLALNYIQNNWF